MINWTHILKVFTRNCCFWLHHSWRRLKNLDIKKKPLCVKEMSKKSKILGVNTYIIRILNDQLLLRVVWTKKLNLCFVVFHLLCFMVQVSEKTKKESLKLWMVKKSKQAQTGDAMTTVPCYYIASLFQSADKWWFSLDSGKSEHKTKKVHNLTDETDTDIFFFFLKFLVGNQTGPGYLRSRSVLIFSVWSA